MDDDPVTAEDASTFAGFWNNLVEDQKYRNFTSRKRRILRYILHPDGFFELNTDLVIHPRVKRDIEGADKPNPLSPAHADFAGHPLLARLLKADLALVPKADSPRELDIHQFRVFASGAKPSPTTSGVHQDGADWVFMHFVAAAGAEPVPSRIFATSEGGSALFEGVLGSFLETLVVNDRLLFHQADPVIASNPRETGWRDMLIVTLRDMSQSEYQRL
ncbi:MAG: 2OG-Fe dioxygenase family protein [Paracoccaceae bacterium]|nr:2OG-Fe dioxygenase family protein [Paracoccaceae bacterium]